MIYDANSIDILGKRKDGGIDMFIVSSGSMDASPQTQTLLLDKVENYLTYVNSPQFQQEFPGKEKSVNIVLQLEEKPPELLLALCEKIAGWTEENGVRFRVEKK